MPFYMHFMFAAGWLLAALLGVSSDAQAFAPGDQVTGLSVSTLDGLFALDLTAKKPALPLVIVNYDSTDAFSRYMWTCNQSVVDFLTNSPENTHYLITSHSAYAENEVSGLQERLLAGLPSLTAAQAATRMQHMHFATTPVPKMANWVGPLLQQWRSPRSIIHVQSKTGDWELVVGRLNPHYGWLPSPEGLASLPIAFVEDACMARAAGNSSLDGQVAVAIASQDCSHAGAIRALQGRGAKVALLGSPAGEEVTELNCRGQECEWPLAVAAAMIPHESAVKIQEALAYFQLQASFTTEQVVGHFAAVDEQGRLAEVGWPKFPTLMTAAWEAQWLDYAARLCANLSSPALRVPIFKDQVMRGEHGISADVTLPPLEELDQYDTLELDMALSCPGTMDADCPVWDHVVQLFVCCDDPEGMAPPCQPCPITPWLPHSPQHRPLSHRQHTKQLRMQERLQQPGSSSREEHSEEAATGQSWAPTDPRGGAAICGPELGRWVTPFRRRIGRWLTDVTPLRPLLASPRCSFTMQAPAWAGDWQPSLNLRFSHSGWRSKAASRNAVGKAEADDAVSGLSRSALHSTADSSNSAPAAQQEDAPSSASEAVPGLADSRRRSLQESSATTQETAERKGSALRPKQVVPLWKGGTFDRGYNRRHLPINFTAPGWTSRAIISAVITGHGYDNNQCAEFCPTSHHFVVNGVDHLVNYTEAGTEWGCADKVPEGVEPNEHGTWHYGRMGWCDGQEVRPWHADVTAALELANGGVSTIEYFSWFQDTDPAPEINPGYIMMESNLVLYA